MALAGFPIKAGGRFDSEAYTRSPAGWSCLLGNLNHPVDQGSPWIRRAEVVDLAAEPVLFATAVDAGPDGWRLIVGVTMNLPPLIGPAAAIPYTVPLGARGSRRRRVNLPPGVAWSLPALFTAAAAAIDHQESNGVEIADQSQDNYERVQAWIRKQPLDSCRRTREQGTYCIGVPGATASSSNF